MLTQYCVGTVAESFLQTEQKGQQNQTAMYEIVSREDCALYHLHTLHTNYHRKAVCHCYGLHRVGTEAWMPFYNMHGKARQRARQIAN